MCKSWLDASDTKRHQNIYSWKSGTIFHLSSSWTDPGASLNLANVWNQAVSGDSGRKGENDIKDSFECWALMLACWEDEWAAKETEDFELYLSFKCSCSDLLNFTKE